MARPGRPASRLWRVTDLRRIDLRGPARRTVDPRDVLPRAGADVPAALPAVLAVCEDVRTRGLPAVLAATERFDHVRQETTRVPPHTLARALDVLDPRVREALEEAARRARVVHQAQRRPDVRVQVAPGGTVTERWVPVRRVGLYVPGGLVAYPSSVVMNVVPAQVAGVRSLAVASPPRPEHGGRPHPAVLAACALLGVDEVYAVGGAQAVAMFAYGTAECPRVDLVTGPGNVYVAAAKRALRGVVGIDSEAGPTEIGILADAYADPDLIAADLVAQAEHDENAACLLVTDAPALAEVVDQRLAVRVAATVHRDRVRAALAGQSATVLVDDLDQGLEVLDEWAPEHLEVLTTDARERAARVVNAGAVFVGPWSPVSLGDYLAGSNHVLPTGGTARHTGGLGVDSFLRGVHVVEYDRPALAAVADDVQALGGAEGLHAHVAAVRARIPVPNAG
ncbi:MAG: histidinol dehydrogenase [Actinomycetes bacterium]